MYGRRNSLFGRSAYLCTIIYTQKLQMFTICVHAQIPMRDVELFCVCLQKHQNKSICAYTQKLQTSSICLDTQIPNRDAELFCVRLQKPQEKKICAYTIKIRATIRNVRIYTHNDEIWSIRVRTQKNLCYY